MPAWLDRLTRGKADAGSLKQRLATYAPYAAPFAGPAAGWTLAQAQANLDYLLQQRAERLRCLGELLAPYAIDTEPALSGADPDPLLDALHRWANEQWPGVHVPKIATRERWLASPRRGGEIVYSMLMDVAILLGELIVRRRPGFRWGLDLDETNGRDGMTSYKRPVLLAWRGGSAPAQVELDVEEIVVLRYLQPRNPALTLLNGWKQLVRDAAAGKYERAVPP